MAHIKTLKSTPTYFDHQLIITTYEDSNFNYVILTRNK
jgi:hypothetical protein